jgi:hypothetical protein
MPKKKEEKKPLDMTTDEAIDYLFGEEAAQKLREIAQGEKPPTGDENGAKTKGRSTRKHDTT